MRDEIIEGIGAWCESLEAAVAEQNTLPETGPAVQQALIGLGELASAVVLVSVDATPDWVGKPVLVESAVSTLFETMTEEGLAQGAAKNVADQKAKYYQNLVSSPEITASAKKYGLPPQTVARDMVDDFVEQMTQAIRSVTPLVLRVAQEPWSVAALEKRLAAATAGTGRRGSAEIAVDEPAPAAAPGGPAAEWYADPMGRHQYRYWDGSSWTTQVADAGKTSTDPLDATPTQDSSATSEPDSAGGVPDSPVPAPTSASPPVAATASPAPASGAERETPTGVRYESADPAKTQRAVELCKYYMERDHPMDAMAQALGVPVQHTKPVFKVVQGGVGRESQPLIDMNIVSVASCLPGEDVDASDTTAVAGMAFAAIEHYAALPKVQALFLLPYHLRTATVVEGSPVPPEEMCRVYSGVENLLVEIYGELPVGGTISDEVVEQKIDQLIRSVG